MDKKARTSNSKEGRKLIFTNHVVVARYIKYMQFNVATLVSNLLVSPAFVGPPWHSGNCNPPHHSFDIVSVLTLTNTQLVDGQHVCISILGPNFKRYRLHLQASQLQEIS